MQFVSVHENILEKRKAHIFIQTITDNKGTYV